MRVSGPWGRRVRCAAQVVEAAGCEGVLVLEVPHGSPAAAAGLRPTHRGAAAPRRAADPPGPRCPGLYAAAPPAPHQPLPPCPTYPAVPHAAADIFGDLVLGDVITAADGRPVRCAADLYDALVWLADH